MPTAELPRRWAWSGLAVVLGGGLALRLWGVAQGLPYIYNADENDHFAPRAIAMFGHGLNPKYFANPPAFTYVLHLVFAVWFGGGAGARHAFALHPDEVYTLARVIAALLGTAALWLLYATGARLFNRSAGLLAASIEAVAFLPVFYAHLALNDVPTLMPLTLSLLGSAGVLRKGRRRDYLLAGIGLGLACASKYTAGIVVLPLLAASATRYLNVEPGARAYLAGRRAAIGLLLAGASALVAFLIANPYAVLDYQRFHSELVHQSTLSAEAQGKLGAPKEGGILYYLWSLTWGLGWVPALAALGGALAVWRKEQRLGWLLVPAPLMFLAFMGLQGRYFGRWLLPIFPILCLLAAFFALRLVESTAPRRLRIGVAALLVAALLVQGLVYSVHSGLVLSRADTRNLTRAWLVANVPKGAMIVAEPVSPDDWAREIKAGTSTASNPYRWPKYPSLLPRISAAGALDPSAEHLVGIEDYVRTLSPALIGYYEQHSYCWVVSGSTQSGRAFADPRAVPQAIAYYAALAKQGEVVYRASPYSDGRNRVAFGFDWSFDYYPLAYHRPGPEMIVYRLRGGRCRNAPGIS
ncbi:MAG TPA: glycosyltransferase family 39 protein [Solirubrobacteraceae bacterium]|nr:glycosyltransferase family 39 protein [Solirubrobacteraceae bacterium]